MAKPQFTLAALATQALPGISFTKTFPVHSDSNYFSAVLRDETGTGYVVQLPKNTAAETLVAEEMLALNALTQAARDALPFAVPAFLGQAPYGKTRAVIFSEVPGVEATANRLDATVAYRIGEAIAAIHSLPANVVSDAGLKTNTPISARETVSEILNRVEESGSAPADLMIRWGRAVDDPSLWNFTPRTIVNPLAADSFKILEGSVVAVSGWAGLSIGDPAIDLKWLLAGVPNAIAQVALDRYAEVLGVELTTAFRNRILLYAELELARWLIHGLDTGDSGIIEDAVAMLRSLADQIEPEATPTREIPIIHNEEEVDEIPDAEEFSFESSPAWEPPVQTTVMDVIEIPEEEQVIAEGQPFFDDSELAAQLENEGSQFFGGSTEQISLDFIDALTDDTEDTDDGELTKPITSE
ncbi:MAG: macrolide 2'-phosphotransferase [Microbacteriaceae bacterium]|nr:macrolide 2'-phosphotransferase [Microbacteriaceae bacterium]